MTLQLPSPSPSRRDGEAKRHQANVNDSLGAGRDRRQKEIVQGRITNGTLFPNMSIAISNNTNSVMKEAEKRLRDIVQKSMRDVQNDFDLTIAPPPESNGTSGGRDGEETARSKHERAVWDQIKLFKEQHGTAVKSIPSLSPTTQAQQHA